MSLKCSIFATCVLKNLFDLCLEDIEGLGQADLTWKLIHQSKILCWAKYNNFSRDIRVKKHQSDNGRLDSSRMRTPRLTMFQARSSKYPGEVLSFWRFTSKLF